MSNLIKSVYFHFDPEEARVIDSDSQMTQFVPEIFQQPKPEEQEYDFEGADGEFQSGISVMNMDDVRQEERERIEQEASEQVEQMLAAARQEAEEMLEIARREAEQIRSEAYAEGKEQGFSEGQMAASQQLQERQNQLEGEFQTKFAQLKEQEEELEPRFAEIMCMLIEKVTGVLCQDKKDVVVYLIHQALNQLERSKNVILRVSKEDMLRVSAHRDELKAGLGEDVEFQISEDDSLGENQCIIETDHRMIDCSLDVQIQNIKDQIQMLTIL